jgi:hypothetical protein
MKIISSLFVLILLLSCTAAAAAIEIPGRDTGFAGEERPLVYRAEAPGHWHYEAPESSNADTMKSIAEFRIEEDGETIRIAIHNFPTKTLKERIPPMAQIFRWKEQFNT